MASQNILNNREITNLASIDLVSFTIRLLASMNQDWLIKLDTGLVNFIHTRMVGCHTLDMRVHLYTGEA